VIENNVSESKLPPVANADPAKGIRVQCFPIYSFIVALDVKVVDFMTVDVEGDELKILKTIPFDKVLIKVLAVEIVTSPEGQGPTREFMESKGYRTLGVFYHGERPFDLIFVHHSVQVDDDDSMQELFKKPKPKATGR